MVVLEIRVRAILWQSCLMLLWLWTLTIRKSLLYLLDHALEALQCLIQTFSSVADRLS